MSEQDLRSTRRFRLVVGAGLSALAVAVVAATIVPGASPAQIRPRPDLSVSAGHVSAANGKLKGSFVVRNEGTARSGRFSAILTVRAPGKKARRVKRFTLHSLKASEANTVKVSVAVPSRLPSGSLPVRVCADPAGKVRELSEGNNCLKLGTVQVGAEPPPTSSAPSSSVPTSSVPTNPISFTKGTPFTLEDAQSNYWVYVPNSYDSTHATPTTLFVWLHGCGGESSGDIYIVSPGGSQDWISIAVGGREGGCWDPSADQAKVTAAIADIKTHFNINPRRVILGGYSSGGDLAYRLAFYNANSFAGVLAENTSPFRDTGSSQAASLTAAAWKFHVVHLAHLQDTTYPIAGVREETDAMVAAGFPLTRIEVDGGHFDEPGAQENGHPVPGTGADLATYLLSHIDDGWTSP